MTTIHLTISGHEFNVPKETLEKFDFFRGMLEVQDNNLILYDICPYTFYTIINMLNNSDFNKNAVILADKLGLESNNSIFKPYKCMRNDCTNFASNGSFCDTHTCTRSGCTDGRLDSKLYCKIHACNSVDCNNVADIVKFDRGYCNSHICPVENCLNVKFTDLYCSVHFCHSQECKGFIKKEGSKYCDEHVCLMPECLCKRSKDTSYCSAHYCNAVGCKQGTGYTYRGTQKIYSNFCSFHKCSVGNCIWKRTNGSFCDFHKVGF